MICLSDIGKSIVDFTTLLEVIKSIGSMGGTVVLAGYPACRLMFGERKWRNCPKEEKTIYSVGVGGGFAVLLWFVLTLVKFMNEEYNAIIGGNEAYLVAALLLLSSLIEIILIAFLGFLRRISLRKKRRS